MNMIDVYDLVEYDILDDTTFPTEYCGSVSGNCHGLDVQSYKSYFHEDLKGMQPVNCITWTDSYTGTIPRAGLIFIANVFI